MLRPPALRPRLLAGLVSAALVGAPLLSSSASADDGDPPLHVVSVDITGGGYPLATSGTVQVTPYVGDQGGFTPRATVHGGAGYPVEISMTDGDYKFQIASSSGTWASEFYDDAASLATADVVTVEGQPVQLAVDLAPRGAIVGRVLDGAGEPVPYADVALFEVGGGWSSGTTAAENGVFVAPAEPGSYQVRVYTPSGGDLVGEWYGDTASRSDATVVTLPTGGAGAAIAPIVLDPGGSVAGTVTGPDGTPVEDVIVGAITADGDQLWWTDTDENGDYRIDRLKPGTVHVMFRDEVGGYLDEWYDDADGQSDATPVPVTASAVTDDVDAVLAVEDDPGVEGTAVTGRALDRAGRPVSRVWVSAWVEGEDGWDWVDETRTDRFGRYALDEIDDRTEPGADTVVRLLFAGDGDEESDHFGVVDTWYGDQPTLKRATSLTVPARQVVTGADARMVRLGGLRGTVGVVDGVALDGVLVTVQDEDGRVVWSEEVDDDGAWATRELVPGAYRVRVEGQGWDPETGRPVMLAPTWWRSGNNFTTATPITVTGGAFAPDVDVELTDRLTAYDAPVVSGSPVVGQVLRATPGRWNVTAGTEYAYTWLRGATVVGRGSTYRPTVADAGSALRVRVDALFWDWEGTSTSAATATVKQVSRTSATASYAKKARTLTLDVRVSAAGLVPTGSVRVSEGKKVLKAALVLRAGKAVLVIKQPARGTHTYVVTYPGSSTLLGSSGQVTVRVK